MEENVHVILQAKMLGGVAAPSSGGSSQHKEQTCFSFVNISVNYVNNYIKCEFESKHPNQKANAFRLYYKNFA